MRMRGLSLETIPPLHIPLRFFLTAPLLGVLAALALLSGGDQAMATQWSPELLGVTHLLTLGFLAMIMLGAMFQLVPVITGRLIPGGWVLASAVHALLLLGSFLLAAGFSGQVYAMFLLAVPLLMLAFLAFLLALGTLLLGRGVGGGDSIFAIRFAALALLLTVALGVLRAAAYAGLAPVLVVGNITNLHLAWGLGGWVLLLVMGASYQVIPMFHVTPSYPVALARTLPLLVFLSLLVLTGFDSPAARSLAVPGVGIAALAYGVFSLHLLGRRKRKLPDVTVRFWRLALVCLCLAATLMMALYFGAQLLPQPGLALRLPVLIGVLAIYGFATSVIMGMLQKIVPFLSYLHLQRSCIGQFELMKTLPHMGMIIPVTRSRWQYRLHLAALAGLLLATLVGELLKPAAVLMLLDFGWLAYTLLMATGLYARTKRSLRRLSVG